MNLRYGPGLATAALALTTLASLAVAEYPPVLTPHTPGTIDGNFAGGPIFSGSHDYGDVVIDVLVTGDITQFLWEYTVTNRTYDPVPGVSNGFSGFELGLPGPVPGLGNIDQTPTGIPPWEVDCCSGLPVEWDMRNSAGLGVMPGASGVFSFTADPTTITVSTGWYHTWQNDGQTDIINYPPGDEPEVPDVFVLDVELCCYEGADGRPICEPVLEGSCSSLGGTVVTDCAECFPIPTENTSWGDVKSSFR